MSEGTLKTLGRVAFEAYCVAVGGRTFDEKPIPGWNELHGDRLKVQGGWEAAAQAVRQYTIDALPAQTPRDFRIDLLSRWEPLGANAWTAPVGTPEPLPPMGAGVLDDHRETVAVNVEDDGTGPA